MSTQILTELPNIQYSGMDYVTVISEIKKILKNNPNWAENWEDFYSSEGGMVFIQLMAWICDNLSIRQDTIYNELFLTTATKKANKIRLLKTIGYKPALAHAAQVPVNIEFGDIMKENIEVLQSNNKDPLYLRLGKIPKLDGKDINGEQTKWELLPLTGDRPDYLGSITLNSGSSLYSVDSNNNIIFAVQGETKLKTLTSDTTDGPFLDLDDKNIAANSIRVYISGQGSPKECQEVSSFVSQEAVNENYGVPYVVEYNENETLRIKFSPKDVLKKERLLPIASNVFVFYRTTNGIKGNIPPKFLNTTYKFSNLIGERNEAVVKNDTLAYGGVNNEELDKAVLNAPLTLRTLDRAVTPEDFDILINANPNVLKSKTYTASNMPDKFKDYYGRYINPQEAFIFTILNKSYKSIPTKEYNNFPWINLLRKPRLNEKYSFGDGGTNKDIEIKNSYNGLTIYTATESKKFDTATILDLGKTFKEKFKKDTNNDQFKLKLGIEKTEEQLFDNIEFSLLEEGLTTKFLSANSNDISVDDNARFITNESFNNNEPVNVGKARFIDISLDGRTSAIIDLWIERPEGVTQGDYWLFWDNDLKLAEPTNDKNKSEDMSEARRRNGIVQLINKQFVGISEGNGDPILNSTIVDVYRKNTSYQYFGLSIKNTDTAINFMSGEKRKDFAITINDKTIDFPIINNKQEGWMISYDDIVYDLNDRLKQTKNYFVLSPSEDSWIDVTEYNNLYPESKCDLSGVSLGISACLSLTDSENYTNKDLYFKFEDNVNNPKKNISISYNENLIAPPVVEEIDATSPISFIHQMHAGLNEVIRNISYSKLLGAKLPAVEYNNIASVKEDPEYKNNVYFEIKSPLTGKMSSIFFTYRAEELTSNVGGDGNFMKDFLNLKFDSNFRSDYAIGIKRAYIVKNNIVNALDRNNKAPLVDIDVGDVIFSNSCIYNNYDFKNIYASYKFNDKKILELGSVYENFYYTGNEEKDKELKDKFIKPTGALFYSTEDDPDKKFFDEAKSDIEIKLTKKPINTNSFYSISESDKLDVIMSDMVKISTAEIKEININTTLSFSMDDMRESDSWLISTNSIHNCKDLLDMIKSALVTKLMVKNDGTPIYREYFKNFNSVAKKSIHNLNVIELSSLHKAKSNITFYEPKQQIENVNNLQLFYKIFLGTNMTNNNLYELYPYKEMNAKNIFIINENGNIEKAILNEKGELPEGTEYFYCPTIGNPLKFEYREIVIKDGKKESRGPDCYIEYDESKNKFNIVKTENSLFPADDFYIHLINDRRGTKEKTDEEDLNSYMNNKKISGMDLVWIQPYIKDYDIKATINYNGAFLLEQVKSSVESAVNKLCSIENSQIGEGMSKSQIISAIMNCDGVRDVDIEYFGLDYMNKELDENKDTKKISPPFYGIACLADFEENKHGLMVSYKAN